MEFTDRVPRYPGRVKLSPVSGQEDIYDMTRADEPEIVGTPINAALFEGMQQETQKQIDALQNIISGQTQTGGGTVARLATGSYVGTGVYGETTPNTLQLPFVPKLLLILPASSSTTLNWWSYGSSNVLAAGSTPGVCPASFVESTKTLTWYAVSGNSRPAQQGNASGVTYHYYVFD